MSKENKKKCTEEPAEDKCLRRREFLTLGACAGLGGLAAAIGGAGVAGYMWPNVSYGTPSKFRIAKTALPDPSQEEPLTEYKVLLRRNAAGELAAISLVCTHLGCTVNRVTTGFLCPCHGSQYDEDGTVVGGPAPKMLAWHPVKKLAGGQLEIDTGTRLEEPKFFAV